MNAPNALLARLALLTQSRLASARTCQRLHHIKYELGYSALVELGGRKFGTLIHKGLEAWWNAKKAGLDDDACLLAALQAIGDEADPFERAKAVVLLTGYHNRWKDEPYEVLAVEVKFTVELRNPATGAASRTWELGGKIDVVVKDLRDGRVLIVEHKTSSEDITPGSAYWRMLRMDGQVSVYFAGALGLGYEAAACLYDVIGKIQQRPGNVAVLDDDGVKVVHDAAGNRVRTKDGKKWRETADAKEGYVLQTRPETADEFRARITEAVAAAPDAYFSRGEVVRLEQEMNDALVDVWQLGQQIRENELAKRHPRNPGACKQYGRMCDFFDVCSGAASLDDTTQFVRRDDVHPELATETQPQGSNQ